MSALVPKIAMLVDFHKHGRISIPIRSQVVEWLNTVQRGHFEPFTDSSRPSWVDFRVLRTSMEHPIFDCF